MSAYRTLNEFCSILAFCSHQIFFSVLGEITTCLSLVAGGFGVRKVLLAWVGKKGEIDSIEAPIAESKISEKYSKRLKDELDGIEL